MTDRINKEPRVEEIFASNVFTLEKMRERLPKNV